MGYGRGPENDVMNTLSLHGNEQGFVLLTMMVMVMLMMLTVGAVIVPLGAAGFKQAQLATSDDVRMNALGDLGAAEAFFRLDHEAQYADPTKWLPALYMDVDAIPLTVSVNAFAGADLRLSISPKVNGFRTITVFMMTNND